MRSLAKYTVLGISGILLFKLLATLVIPIFGIALGLLALTVKLALLAAVAFGLYTLLRQSKEKGTTEAV